MLGFLIGLWRRLTKIRRQSVDQGVRTIALFSALILVEGIVESVAGPVFEYSLQAFVLAVAIGIALRASAQQIAQ
jgi:type III secretory pathway component EscS